MIYAYDLLVNLNDRIYDFYDWDSKDNLIHIRRVPLFKVDNKTYLDILYKNVKIKDIKILNSIKDKTQVFTTKVLELINYSMVITNEENALLILLDSKGNVKEKSKFLVNEELEITELSNKLKVTQIDYIINNNKIIYNKLLRSEEKIINLIISKLKYIENDNEKINYLYYEWFKKEGKDNKYEKLMSDITRKFTDKHLEFLETLNLILGIKTK